MLKWQQVVLTLPTADAGGCAGDVRGTLPRRRPTGLRGSPGPSARGAASGAAAIAAPCVQHISYHRRAALSPSLTGGARAPEEHEVTMAPADRWVCLLRRSGATATSGAGTAPHLLWRTCLEWDLIRNRTD
jgi:hypothetical protein